jgi:hypothetical protein
MHDCDGEREPLANAERQIQGPMVDVAGQTETFDQVGDARRRLLRRQVIQMGMQCEILPNSQFGIE